MSGQACIRLCGLVEQSSKSYSDGIRQWALSQDVTLKLFNFYIEWNESDNHRSMKLVLDLVAQCILKNPDREGSLKTKQSILDNLISIVIGRSTKPVAKSAIKTLDHFLSKGVFSLDDIKLVYLSFRKDLSAQDDVETWRIFTVDLFHWMRLHFVCPTAGRLIVTIYRFWRQGKVTGQVPTIEIWHEWLLDVLAEEPNLLESLKNYVFLPLFKLDRPEALRFLEMMNEDHAVSGASDMDMNTPALLQLAALETGKRVGLVEEPGKSSLYSTRLGCMALTSSPLKPLATPTSRQEMILPLPFTKMCWRVYLHILLMKFVLWHCLCSSRRHQPHGHTRQLLLI